MVACENWLTNNTHAVLVRGHLRPSVFSLMEFKTAYKRILVSLEKEALDNITGKLENVFNKPVYPTIFRQKYVVST